MAPQVSSILPTAFTAASAAAALGMLLATLRGLRRSEASAAREEALALAQTRAQMIAELEARVAALERERALAELHVRALQALLEDVRRELRGDPAAVERVLARLDELLAPAA